MMNEAFDPAAPVAIPAERRLVAPLWHTAVLIAVLLGLAAYGAYMQGQASEGPQLVQRRGSALGVYLTLIVSQWALLRFVTAGGLRKTKTRLRDLIGARWSGWRDVARDIGIALAVWAVWSLIEYATSKGLGADNAKDISSMLPRGPAEIAVWVLLSMTAGFCEESIFRGYLQTQFRALTGSVVAAVAIQAVIFGVSHGYQGLRNVIAITVFGAIFGALAAWRKSLKPGMILHAWTDIFSGIFGPR